MNNQSGPYNVAIIGLGKIGLLYDFASSYGGPLSHTFAYMRDNAFCVIAGADNYYPVSEKFLSVAKKASFYSDYKTMLREIQKLDVVSVCSPPQYHLEQLAEILNTTKARAIFCEKPVVQNVTEYSKLKKSLEKSDCVLIPNISRRFNVGLQTIKKEITQGIIGDIQKVHVRYTRGIYNTGSHLFDLLSWWVGNISKVLSLYKVCTSSEMDGENTYSFNFVIDDNIPGYAEAFDDRQYYLFEIDIFGDLGKIEFRNSGDSINIFNITDHQLFPGHKGFHLNKTYHGLLAESNFLTAMKNIKEVLENNAEPLCQVGNAAYPLYVAEAIERSYGNKRWEMVKYEE